MARHERTRRLRKRHGFRAPNEALPRASRCGTPGTFRRSRMLGHLFEIVVEDQRQDPGSLLSWMTRTIGLRKQCPEVGQGTWELLDCGKPSVLAMRYEWLDTSLVLVHNFSRRAQTLRLSSSKDVHDESTTLVDLLDEKYLRPTAQGVFRTEVDGYGYRWYRVGSLQTAAERRGAPEPE